MILQKLVELADHEQLMGDPDFEPKGVAWIVVIDLQGNILEVRSTHQQSGNGKKMIPASINVPRSFGTRTVGIAPEFLVDNSKYVFGLLETKNSKNIKRTSKLVDAFIGLAQKTLDETEDEGLAAQVACLKAIKTNPSLLFDRFKPDTNDKGTETIHISGQNMILPGLWTESDIFAFRCNGSFVYERPAIVEHWRNIRSNVEGEKVTCLVTGKKDTPAEKHLTLKVIGAATSGAPLVSFNANAFESYGLKGNKNAPISRVAAEKYGTALRRLLDRNGWLGSDGQVLPKGNILLPGPTTVVFWSNSHDIMDMFNQINDGDADAVRVLYSASWKGKKISLDDTSEFNTLVLSGAQGRIILREAIMSTVKDVLQSLHQHFDDLDIILNAKDANPYPALNKLLYSIKQPGDNTDVPGRLVTGFYRASIDQRIPYPDELLAAALSRIRAHNGISDNRVRLIKAVINRKARLGIPIKTSSKYKTFKPLEKEMDTENTTTPYRLGRLLASLEKIQAEAIGPKADIIDRFMTSACVTPALVFPRLLTLHQHHIGKLQDGRRIFFSKLVDEILNCVPAHLPKTLTLDDQGVFMIGYHHQRADLWKSKADKQ